MSHKRGAACLCATMLWVACEASSPARRDEGATSIRTISTKTQIARVEAHQQPARVPAAGASNVAPSNVSTRQRSSSLEGLPAGAYFASRYRDARRRFETWEVYFEDGRVEAFDGRGFWLRCRLSPEDITVAKAAIQRNLQQSPSKSIASSANDTAVLRYTWRVSNNSGSIFNANYPATDHPAMKRARNALDNLLNRVCPEPLRERAKGFPVPRQRSEIEL